MAESDVAATLNVTENEVEVTVTLSADPERTVIIPIETDDLGGAGSGGLQHVAHERDLQRG